MAQNQSEIRYLNPPTVEVKKKKYCRFKKSGIKYVDYKDAEFLKKFLNEQGKILPRRLTGTSQKFQKKVFQNPSGVLLWTDLRKLLPGQTRPSPPQPRPERIFWGVREQWGAPFH